MKYRSPIMLLHHRHEIVQPTPVVVAILLINYVISILCTYVYIYIYIKINITICTMRTSFSLSLTPVTCFFFFFFFLLPFPLLLFFFLFQSMNNSHKANVVRLLRAFFLITRIQAWFFSPPPLFLFS